MQPSSYLLVILVAFAGCASALRCHSCSTARACAYANFWAPVTCESGPNNEPPTCYKITANTQVYRRGCTLGRSCASVPDFDGLIVDCVLCADADLCNDDQTPDPGGVSGGSSDVGQQTFTEPLVCHRCDPPKECHLPTSWQEENCTASTVAKCYKFVDQNGKIEQLGCVENGCQNAPNYRPGVTTCRICQYTKCNTDFISGGSSQGKSPMVLLQKAKTPKTSDANRLQISVSFQAIGLLFRSYFLRRFR